MKYTSSLLLSALVILLMSSCNLFKSVPSDDTVYDDTPEEIKGGKVYNPETGKEEEVHSLPTKLDTIQWRNNPSTDTPPITTNGDNTNGDISKEENNDPLTEDGNTETIKDTDPFANANGEVFSTPTTKKDTYEVTLMLPFVTNKFDVLSSSIYQKSEWALQYYGGVKMALDQLRAQGVNLNVNILDTQGNENIVARQVATNEGLQKADLIIGPYRSVNVRQVAKYAKNNQTPLVSPYSAAARISNDNPYLIQVNPSLNTHIAKITEHVLKNHKAEDVVLVVRDRQDEKARLALFQEAHRQIEKSADVTTFKELIIPEAEEAGYSDLVLREYINKNKNTVFIVPSWSSELFINSFLRQVQIARSDYDNIVVYGMPKWREYENTDYSYYENLKVHISETFFTTPDDVNASSFRKNFYNRYGKRPEQAGYFGYADMLYFGRQILKNGTQFQQFLPENQEQLIHTRYAFKPVYNPLPAGSDAFAPVVRFENKYVHILKFSDYQWQKASL